MTDQTIVAQTAPQEQPAPARAKQPRQLVRFTFYKLDSQWQLLPPEQREQGKQQLRQIVEKHGEQALVRAYSLFGLRTDCDFLIWQAAYSTDDLQSLHSKIRRSPMGPYLREVYGFLSMTKRSIYVGKKARGA